MEFTRADAIAADTAFVDRLTTLRRDIHRHPETAFEEVRTADVVADKLKSFGIEVHRGLAKTGVVGVLRSGTSKRAIGLRADMDALPMTELNTFAHASKFPGRMHACGHDGHVAMLLAAARHLANHRNFDGTVYLIFQPAEEGGGGAREMIRDGLFERFPVEAVFRSADGPEQRREGLLLGRDEQWVLLNVRGRTQRIPRDAVLRVLLVQPHDDS